MATKIITPGTDTYRATCTECGCCFSYERSDVHHNYVKGGEWVSCPQCGHGHYHRGADDFPRRGPMCRPKGAWREV